MKSPALNSCFRVGAGALATAGFARGAFDGCGLGSAVSFAGGSLEGAAAFAGAADLAGGGALGGTSLRAGPETFFLTAADIPQTFQMLGAKEPYRPELRR
jgi:hypothetical protein